MFYEKEGNLLNTIIVFKDKAAISTLKLQFKIFQFSYYVFTQEQVSLPAGNRKRRTAHGITCPSTTYARGWVPQSWLGGNSILAWLGGYPNMGYPPTWDWSTPRKGPGTSHWGTPRKGHETSGSMIGWRWVPPVNRQTPMKT